MKQHGVTPKWIYSACVALMVTAGAIAACSSKKKVVDNPQPAPNEPVETVSIPRVNDEYEVNVPNVQDIPTAYFAFDSATLASSARNAVRQQADAWKRSNQGQLWIIGGADERGTEAYNKALGMRRAQAVSAELQRWGVPRRVIHLHSVGEGNAVAMGHDEYSWARNRRAEMHMTLPKSLARLH